MSAIVICGGEPWAGVAAKRVSGSDGHMWSGAWYWLPSWQVSVIVTCGERMVSYLAAKCQQ